MEKKDKEMEALAGEIISGMKDWRAQNPKATFAEIERETMKRMAALQARLMAEIACDSEAREWEAGAGPQCPECGERMKGVGKHKRKLQASGGSEVELERQYARCPACGAGFFPSG
jgi:DNA-directed RNA polymerase subunit RPC12/RpoP